MSAHTVLPPTTYGLAELPALVRRLLGLSPPLLWTLSGEPGAGKTTLVSELLHQLGGGAASSPTFALHQRYPLALGQALNHWDFYRLRTADEVLALGLDDWLHSGEWNIIEWPELAMPWLPQPFWQISLRHLSPQLREIEVCVPLSSTRSPLA